MRARYPISSTRLNKTEDQMSLETDVMRFVAIIAFCLLAITLENKSTIDVIEQPSSENTAGIVSEEPIVSRETYKIDMPKQIRPSDGEVRFESDAAFLNLIMLGQLSLFASPGIDYYHVDAAGVISKQHALPSHRVRLHRTTVPQNVVASSGLENAVWWVVFSPGLRGNLVKMKARFENKPVSLVILGNGSIITHSDTQTRSFLK